jgi:Holliday junction resolvase RusA-like endonuclease
MVDHLTFAVPWSGLCSDNRKFINGQFILTKEYRASKELIGALSLAAARKAKWTRQEGPLALEVVVREPDRRRRDLNWSKNAKDGITAGEAVWWDDSQVRWELWRFVEPCDKATAGAQVTIRVLDGFQDAPHIAAHAPTPVGRSDDVRPEPPKRLQRQRRVRRGAAAAVEPAGAVAGGPSGGRQQAGAPRQRRTGGAVPRRQAAPKAQARPVRTQTSTTATTHHFELESAR